MELVFRKFRLSRDLISCFLVVLLTLTVGCRDSNETPVGSSGAHERYSLETTPAADIEVLFIGNSHSSYNNLPGLVQTLIEHGVADKSVNAFVAPGWGFLADRVNDGFTYETIQARPWTHVILQAQKYSTTGLYTYPTSAAELWIKRIKEQNAIPVMFPEWPRKFNYEEGLRVHQLHMSIAATEPACVAPIGLTWDLAIERYPQLEFHASDGNHSNPRGALLSAYVFYEVITEQLASELPYIASLDFSAEEQQLMRETASEVIAANPPCPFPFD